MSRSFECMQWNACVQRLDLGLYSHWKEFRGMDSEPMLTPREKSPPSEKISSEEDRTHNTASSRTASPTHYQQAILASKLVSKAKDYSFSFPGEVLLALSITVHF